MLIQTGFVYMTNACRPVHFIKTKYMLKNSLLQRANLFIHSSVLVTLSRAPNFNAYNVRCDVL